MCVLLAPLAAACGETERPGLADRLWVSDVPASPKESFSGFAVAQVKGRSAGALYQGSMYEGRQRVFRLESRGSRVTFVMMQDGERLEAEIRNCKPTTGFHVCVELVGAAAIEGRYQSRKRWTLRRGKPSAAPVDFMHLLGSLESQHAGQP